MVPEPRCRTTWSLVMLPGDFAHRGRCCQACNLGANKNTMRYPNPEPKVQESEASNYADPSCSCTEPETSRAKKPASSPNSSQHRGDYSDYRACSVGLRGMCPERPGILRSHFLHNILQNMLHNGLHNIPHVQRMRHRAFNRLALL